MKKVLVTGGNGFIGSHIVRRLVENGYEVAIFDVKEPDEVTKWWLNKYVGQFSYTNGNIENWGNVVEIVNHFRPDAIVHLAAIINPVYLNTHPRLALKVNLEGTFNVLESSRIFDVSRVVYFSSIGVLPSVQYRPIDNNHPVLLGTEGPGTNFYGSSKVSEEAFCWAYHQSYGLDFITIRPSAVYGFGMRWPLFVKPMVENSINDLPTRFDHGRDFPRDYTHVDDIAQLVQKAIEVDKEKVKDRIFYGATGSPLVTAGDVAEIVKAQIPGADITIGEGLSEGDLLEIRYRAVMDIQNAIDQLGYEPEFRDVKDGVADYIKHYREYKKSKA